MDKLIEQRGLPLYRKMHDGQTIIVACGCFDIFHIGHLTYLQGAKSIGDLLFVGVNSDRSVIENKSKSPVFTARQRMSIIAALDCVDYVFCFDELTFDKSLTLLRPEVFARGSDAILKDFPEISAVKKIISP